MAEGEKILLSGIPVPRVELLEVPGADRASYQCATEPPVYLGGDVDRQGVEVLLHFGRTEKVRGGYPVFLPLADEAR